MDGILWKLHVAEFLWREVIGQLVKKFPAMDGTTRKYIVVV